MSISVYEVETASVAAREWGEAAWTYRDGFRLAIIEKEFARLFGIVGCAINFWEDRNNPGPPKRHWLVEEFSTLCGHHIEDSEAPGQPRPWWDSRLGVLLGGNNDWADALESAKTCGHCDRIFRNLLKRSE